jgi:hypothetical protein
MQDEKTTQPDSAKTENIETPKPITNQDDSILEDQIVAINKDMPSQQISLPPDETTAVFGKKITDKTEPQKNDEIITAQKQASETEAVEKTTGNSGLQD